MPKIADALWEMQFQFVAGVYAHLCLYALELYTGSMDVLGVLVQGCQNPLVSPGLLLLQCCFVFLAGMTMPKIADALWNIWFQFAISILFPFLHWLLGTGYTVEEVV